MASNFATAAVAAAAAFLFACNPYTPTAEPGPDAGDDAMIPDGDDGPDTPPGPVALTVTLAGAATGTVTSNPAGIDCGATCSATFDPGTMITLSATPDADAEFAGWSGACSGFDPCTVTLDAATAVTATFEVPVFPITVALGGNGTGTVSGGAIACPGTCSTDLALGAQLTLTAAPTAGSIFTGWSGACSGTASCVVIVDGAVDVTANFALNQTLIVAKSGNGTGTVTSAPSGITCGGVCDQTYSPGTMVTLTAAADADSIFTGWTGGGCSGTSTCVVTVNSAVQVTATFVLRQFTLTVDPNGAGTGTVTSTPAGIDCGADCNQLYDIDTMVMLTAAPSIGSLFGGWSGGGCSGTGSCLVIMTAATTVSADFAPIVHTLTVARAGTGSGTVSSTPVGITCGADCSEDYVQGAMVTLTAMPSAGSSFTGWSGGACTGTGSCLVTMTAAATAIATFTIVQYPLNVATAGAGSGTVTSSPLGIACGADCVESYNAGTGVTLTAIPATGSTFTGWNGGGCSGTGTCLVTVNAAATVTATFALSPYPLTVARAGTGAGSVTSSPSGITCGADCSESYDFGTSVTLTAMPATGSTFTGWTGGGCTGTGTCLVAIGAATSVTATFTAMPYLLTVSKTGAGTGTIGSNPAGISCGADCSDTYDHGTIITLTATPSAGSTFGGWSGGGCAGTGTCIVTLTAATSVSASFTLDPFSLTVTKAGTGAGSVTSNPNGITCGADCTEAYASGTMVTLTAAPSVGSTFGGWSGGGCSGTGTCVVTIASAVTVTASFTIIDYPLMVSKAGTGSGAVSSVPSGITCGADCTEPVGHGASMTLTATPSAGSTFGGWSGGGCSGTGTCVVTVTAATTVTATFTLTTPTLTVVKAGTGAGTVSSAPIGISCGADCAEPYAYNTSVTLTATPSTGSTFTGWTGGGCTGTAPCVVPVTADTTVTATFAIITYPLTAAKSGTGAGTVSSAPAGITCGATCTASFNYNTQVTLTATASTGSTFTGWTGGGCSGTGTCVVNVTAATTVTAGFSILQYQLNVARSGTGTGAVNSSPFGINCGSDCTQLYDYNTQVTLTATAATGSTFTGWTGGGCSGTGTCVVNMTAATSVTAGFAINLYTLIVSKPGTGSGSVGSAPSGITCGATCTHSYNYNTQVTLTATPSVGSTFTGWGGVCSGTGSCVVTMATHSSVSATFTISQYPLNVIKNGNGAGTVTHSTDINCGADCMESFNYNTQVVLTAAPAVGSSIAGWSGGGCSGTNTTCTVPMTAATNVTVTFSGFPTGLTTTGGRAKVTLAWTAVTGATRYHVYAGLNSGTYTQNWYTTDATPSSIDNTTTTHYYVVKAVHPSGESANSAEVSGTGWANLSRSHATSQSSDWSATVGHSQLAVDGNTNGDFGLGSVTTTNWGANEWWQVDLGASHSIKALDIYNRTDCCANELSNFLVFTSTDGISQTGRISGAPQAGSPSAFTFTSVTGRYLRIQLQAPASALMLAEVDVWGI